jgi:hypothetical protein
MMWKTIGQSVAGTSHITSAKGCEDATTYTSVQYREEEALICACSDGAGSALYAAVASAYATREVISLATAMLQSNDEWQEADIFAMLENIYDGLATEAANREAALEEFSCTLLGCIITPSRSAFFQVGDGAIVRNDGTDFYTPVWWPYNGEYQNTTAFLTDDSTLNNVNILITEEPVTEVAIFTDGLQMLALNTETRTAHQPFFTDLFRYLRMASDEEKINVLNRKLAEYLDSKNINDRTDDDKTLLLATMLPA